MYFLFILTFLPRLNYSDKVFANEPLQLTVTNWTKILTGEWLVDFFAPWCPACQHLAPEWRRLASYASKMKVNIAQLDCTAEAAVAAIFTITSLPTIYHIKDGVFRSVEERRSVEELQEFVENKLYLEIIPEKWSYSPNALYMPILVRLIDLGLSITKLHQHLIAKGIPNPISLAILGSGILLSGTLFGVVLVMICDCCCPPRPQILRFFGGKDERPQPIITKLDDTQDDSIIDDDTENTEATIVTHSDDDNVVSKRVVPR